MDAEIPVVDISGLTRTDSVLRSAVARQIGTACRSIGFFAIRGHGIPASQIDDAFAAARAVFALPPEAKSELAIGLHGHNRGYVGMGVEALDEHTAPDLKEAYNLVWTDGGATRRPPGSDDELLHRARGDLLSHVRDLDAQRRCPRPLPGRRCGSCGR